MKKNDIILILVVVFITGAFTLILSGVFISPAKHQQSVEVVEPISSEFPEADNRYFNDKAVNPTQPIQIGSGSNNQASNR